MSSFGDRLSELRKLNNMKQHDLAEILKVTVATVSNYENGHKRPNDEIKLLIAETFNVSLDYLLGAIRDEYKLDRSDVLKLPDGFYQDDKSGLLEYAEFLMSKHKK